MNDIIKVLSKQKNWIVVFPCFNLARNDSSVFERLKAKSFNVSLMHQHLCLSIHLTTVVGAFSRPLKVATTVPVSKCRLNCNFCFCQKQNNFVSHPCWSQIWFEILTNLEEVKFFGCFCYYFFVGWRGFGSSSCPWFCCCCCCLFFNYKCASERSLICWRSVNQICWRCGKQVIWHLKNCCCCCFLWN